MKKSPEIIKYLRDHNYHNVGILKFRVHKANHPTSFTVGPINDNLPTRLENALIAANPTSAPIGIIHDASGAAAKSGFPKYDTDAGQRALFSRKYPLAWEVLRLFPM